jgi:membrane-associated phospholipid phosphatase
MLRKTLKDNQLFFIPYILTLLFLVPFLFAYSKIELHVFINQYHTGFFDIIFAHLTYVGDGMFVIIPVIILLFFSLRHSVFLLTAYLGTGLITQILKRVFFEDVLRPSKFIKDINLYLIEGVDLLTSRSFPSGHATSAFALFLSIALISGNRYVKVICFIFACLVAFSRVYLSQHFLIDIIAGSMIGCMGTLAVFQLFYKKDRRWHTLKIQNSFKHYRHA